MALALDCFALCINLPSGSSQTRKFGTTVSRRQILNRKMALDLLTITIILLGLEYVRIAGVQAFVDGRMNQLAGWPGTL